MKKIAVIFLLLCLALTFTGCDLGDGNGNEFLISKTAPYDYCYGIGNVSLDNSRNGNFLIKGQEDRPVYDNIIMELMALTPDKLTPEYKAELTKKLELYHFEYHWNEDNSLTIISEGEEMTFGKTTDWPTSPEWVKSFPVPKGITVKEAEASAYSVRLTVSMTLEEAKAYVADLKAAGFTYNVRETTMVGYTYYATNQDNLTVSVTYSSLIQLIELSAPEHEDETGENPGISHELPKTGLVEYLPAITFGKVENVLDEGDSLTISLSGVSAADANSFITKCKAKFNSYVLNDTESDGMRMYMGIDAHDISLSVVFIGEILTIVVSK